MVKHTLRLAAALVLLGLGGAVSAAQSSPAIPPATAEFRAAEGDQWIPFTGLADHQIIIPVEINGVAAHALVDTGAPYSTLDRAWALNHGIAVQKRGVANSTNGMITPQWQGPLGSFHVGGFHQRGGDIDIVDTAQIPVVEQSTPFDMIIGLDVLSNFATDVDFDHARIRFHQSGAPVPQGTRVPVRLDAAGERLYASLHFGGKAFDKIVVDTGDSDDLATLKSSFGTYPADMRVTDVESGGLGGLYLADYAMLRDVRWGDLAFTALPTKFEDQPAGPGEQGGIGLEMLERYNLFLDPAKGVMVLGARQHPPAPPHTTNMGIQGAMTGEGWLVIHVMKNSPAAAAGLKEGERICTVDGVKMGAASEIPRGADGTQMHLDLCDGRQLTLSRATFY